MKLNYHVDTDSLYIDLSERPSAESREISEGVVLDYDSAGNLVGIDIDNASETVDLKKLTLSKLPGIVQLTQPNLWRSAIFQSNSHKDRSKHRRNSVQQLKLKSSPSSFPCQHCFGAVHLTPISPDYKLIE